MSTSSSYRSSVTTNYHSNDQRHVNQTGYNDSYNDMNPRDRERDKPSKHRDYHEHEREHADDMREHQHTRDREKHRSRRYRDRHRDRDSDIESRSSDVESDDDEKYRRRNRKHRKKSSGHRSRSPSPTSSDSSNDRRSRSLSSTPRKTKLNKKESSKSHSKYNEKDAALLAYKVEARLREELDSKKDEMNNGLHSSSSASTSTTSSSNGPNSLVSSVINPHDTSIISQPFLWRKKVEKEVERGEFDEEKYTSNALRERQHAKEREIEELRRRRELRAIEKKELEALRDALLREENQDSESWESKEKEWEKQQKIQKSKKRIAEHRFRAIDLLAKNVSMFEIQNDSELLNPLAVAASKPQRHNNNDHDVVNDDNATTSESNEMDSSNVSESAVEEKQEDVNRERYDQLSVNIDLIDPVSVIEKCTIDELQEAKEDAMKYKDDATNAVDNEYWNACLIAIESQLRKLYAKEQHEKHHTRLPTPIRSDIEGMLKNKNLEELQKLEQSIYDKMHSDEEVDVVYWTSVLDELQLYKSRAFLTGFHNDVVHRRHGIVKLIGEGAAEGKPDTDTDASRPSSELTLDRSQPHMQYGRGRDRGRANESMSLADRIFAAEMAKPLAADENRFSVEVDVSTLGNNNKGKRDGDRRDRYSSRSYGMQRQGRRYYYDAYQLRKPRYMNKVKTGYDWNKYNQTHYSKENPPPKIVQGYKFWIMYHDLIDPTQAPTYTLEPSPDGDKEYQIIRFSAGAPYQDIAFKIVNKEWEYSRKHGFRCVFDRGVLMLHFNFKRYFYRR